MIYNLELLAVIGMSYMFVFGLFVVFSNQLNKEREKNDRLIDSIIAKNLPEKTRKKIVDAKLNKIMKQTELPFVQTNNKNTQNIQINRDITEKPLEEGEIE